MMHPLPPPPRDGSAEYLVAMIENTAPRFSKLMLDLHKYTEEYIRNKAIEKQQSYQRGA